MTGGLAAPVVRAQDWDAALYMPWPRFEPLPGRFGRHRRLRDNLRQVAEAVGPCAGLHIHSAVFDTEAINYFLRGLPKLCGATDMRARILPDGLISIRRYPLSAWKRAAQWPRKLRKLFAPELDYWCFGGDRIGSDAPFCDRIYVLPGLPHEYPADKVVVLPPLADAGAAQRNDGVRRALLIGQPLEGAGLMSAQDRDEVAVRIRHWLSDRGIDAVDYKGHPKDPGRELCRPEYHLLQLDEPLETYMSKRHYDVVAGVRSSALLFARQLYGPDTQVVAFGWDRVRFKNSAERADMEQAFRSCAVELIR